MLSLKATFLLLLLACLVQHILQAEGRKGQQERKGRGRGQAKHQDTTSLKPTLHSRQGTERKSRGSGGKAASKGRFSTKDKLQCNWVVTGDRALVLSISCTKGNESFQCEYTANPGLCPQYESNSGTFWKQITRAMKKQKKLCRDPKALLKAGVCKSASKEAHFSLKTPTQAQHPPQPGKKDCKGLSDRNKLAKEHCSSSWSSVCTFFFAMFENEEC